MRQQRQRTKVVKILKFNLWLLTICGMANCFLTTPTGTVQQRTTHQAESLSIQFGNFSPAYAAFEDEYLFEGEVTNSTQLLAGDSEQVYVSHAIDDAILTPKDIHPMAFVIHNEGKNPIPFYDAELSNPSTDNSKMPFASPSQPLKLTQQKKRPIEALASETTKPSTAPQFVLSLGPIVASAVSANGSNSPWQPGRAQNAQSAANPATGGMGQQSVPAPHKKESAPTSYNVSGDLQLVGGLAFLGALEVSWIVDGEEVARGQIALDEGRYAIDVQGLTGHIVISLYDENEYLVGEGSANLDELAKNQSTQWDQIAIKVEGIDTSLAGKVKSVYSIGSTTDPIADAEISLFGIEASATSDEDGEYHFNEWKNSDSKTLALASKAGYKDSVFLVDSNHTQDVILLSDSYADAFFSRLREMGYPSEIANKGLVYGTIKRPSGPSNGLRAEIEGYKSIYLQSYFAMEGQVVTDDSGIFTIVGLDDGDHILRIYDGQTLVDRRVLAIEGGKVSPVEIDLKPQTKILRFVDPLFNEPIAKTGTRFFDGEYTINEDPERAKNQLSRGNDPALLEFALEDGQENTVFVSRNDQFQEVPVVNRKWLDQLNNELKLKVQEGVAFGFIETDQSFRVVVAEGPPTETLYFDTAGNILEKPGPSMAGFLLLGLDEGLHTLMIESPTGDELYFTDLIYTDLQSHSVILHKL